MNGQRGRYKLPPLNALRMFESAARHCNFRVAAEEQGVTQGAVAQQVRALEEYLGAKLFSRRPRGLELTEEGRRYLRPVQRALILVSGATRTFVSSKTTVTISVTPSFAAKWLIPRLGSIAANDSALDVQVLATNALSNFQSDGVDIAVRHMKPPCSPGMHADLLFATTVFAVCSPRLVANHPITTAGDLQHHVLLHDAHGLWPLFLDRAGVDADVGAFRSLKFSHASLAIDAAIGGQGIALATEALVDDDLRNGRLVSPLDLSLHDDLGFYVLCPRTHLKRGGVKWIRDWLLSQRPSVRSGESAPGDL